MYDPYPPSETSRVNPFTQDRGSLGRLAEEGTKNEGPHAMFGELAKVDHDFTRFINGLGWSAEPAQWKEKAQDVVKAYIDTIKKHRGDIDKNMLLNPDNSMGGRIDPVFAFLVRTMVGGDIMTPDVFQRIRSEWCTIDIPSDAGELLRVTDDRVFAHEFEDYPFDQYSNVKLKALQDRGIRDLIDESREWKAGQAGTSAPVTESLGTTPVPAPAFPPRDGSF